MSPTLCGSLSVRTSPATELRATERPSVVPDARRNDAESSCPSTPCCAPVDNDATPSRSRSPGRSADAAGFQSPAPGSAARAAGSRMAPSGNSQRSRAGTGCAVSPRAQHNAASPQISMRRIGHTNGPRLGGSSECPRAIATETDVNRLTFTVCGRSSAGSRP